jgi:hypothetical protein
MEEKPIIYEQLEKLCGIAVENNFREAVVFLNNVLIDYDLFYAEGQIADKEGFKKAFKGIVDIMKEVYVDQISKPGWKGANW